MSRMNFVRNLIPIGIYFLVESFFGALWGMVAGVSLSLISAGFGFIKNRRFDKAHFFDIAFILVFGVLEIFFGQEGMRQYSMIIFASLIALILGLSVWSRYNVFTLMGGGMMDSLLSDPFRRLLMKKSMMRMFFWSVIFIVFLNVMLFFPASLKKEELLWWSVWAFVIGFFALELLVSRRSNKKYSVEEWQPIVTEDGKVVGRAPRRFFHNGTKWLHPVVHLHVLTSKGLLLQKRPMNKQIQPGKWDTATGGHVAAGESIEKALQREAFEEIGLQSFEARLLKQYVWESAVERELVFSFVTIHNGPFRAGTPEVEELREWTTDELNKAKELGEFTPNLIHELEWVVGLMEK